ncbi:MAG: peptidase M75 [Parabacteroides sp.]|nr:peptidase M75 [Parabacteroides sp.]
MIKKFFYFSALMLGLMVSMSACSDDDEPNNNNEEVDSTTLDYSAEYATAWGNYMYNVAKLLKQDAAELYAYWNDSYKGGVAYAETFKHHDNSTYPSAISCIQELIEGCATIANEVGVAKIGEPYDLYKAGKTEEALYAVESWYSWHSRDDYTNNIWSIRNCYYGSLDGTIHEKSLSALVASVNVELDTNMKEAIANAAKAIQDIPQPFRNNINSKEASDAMAACADLEEVLNSLNSFTQNTFGNASYDAQLDVVVDHYVDAVVLPTYKALAEKNSALFDAVNTFKNNPSDLNFEKACEAWLTAREPWEKSEAFLFGPVDSEGLDPNMDSWPLDQDAIFQILKSGNFNEMEWGDGDDDDTVSAAQNVRGYHTLEYLLFKDGEPRKVNN